MIILFGEGKTFPKSDIRDGDALIDHTIPTPGTGLRSWCVVEAVGSDVINVEVGDRVMASSFGDGLKTCDVKNFDVVFDPVFGPLLD